MPFFKGKRPEDIAEMVNCPLARLGVKEVFKKFPYKHEFLTISYASYRNIF